MEHRRRPSVFYGYQCQPERRGTIPTSRRLDSNGTNVVYFPNRKSLDLPALNGFVFSLLYIRAIGENDCGACQGAALIEP
jgi:hypothetical protein